MEMSNELFMNFGVFEANIGEQKGNSERKVVEVSDHRAKVERLGGGSWTSDDFRGATEALRQYENRVTDNAMTQAELARRGGVSLMDGMDTAKFAQATVNGLLGS
jgi:hypothetical protein